MKFLEWNKKKRIKNINQLYLFFLEGITDPTSIIFKLHLWI